MDLQMIGIVVTVGVFMLGLLVTMTRLALGQFERRISELLAGVQKSIADEAAQARELKRQVEALIQSLPVEYVRREDWIRFSTVIDAKLDRVGDRISDLTRAELARMTQQQRSA